MDIGNACGFLTKIAIFELNCNCEPKFRFLRKNTFLTCNNER